MFALLQTRVSDPAHDVRQHANHSGKHHTPIIPRFAKAASLLNSKSGERTAPVEENWDSAFESECDFVEVKDKTAQDDNRPNVVVNGKNDRLLTDEKHASVEEQSNESNIEVPLVTEEKKKGSVLSLEDECVFDGKPSKWSNGIVATSEEPDGTEIVKHLEDRRDVFKRPTKGTDGIVATSEAPYGTEIAKHLEDRRDVFKRPTKGSDDEIPIVNEDNTKDSVSCLEDKNAVAGKKIEDVSTVAGNMNTVGDMNTVAGDMNTVAGKYIPESNAEIPMPEEASKVISTSLEVAEKESAKKYCLKKPHESGSVATQHYGIDVAAKEPVVNRTGNCCEADELSSVEATLHPGLYVVADEGHLSDGGVSKAWNTMQRFYSDPSIKGGVSSLECAAVVSHSDSYGGALSKEGKGSMHQLIEKIELLFEKDDTVPIKGHSKRAKKFLKRMKNDFVKTLVSGQKSVTEKDDVCKSSGSSYNNDNCCPEKGDLNVCMPSQNSSYDDKDFPEREDAGICKPSDSSSNDLDVSWVEGHSGVADAVSQSFCEKTSGREGEVNGTRDSELCEQNSHASGIAEMDGACSNILAPSSDSFHSASDSNELLRKQYKNPERQMYQPRVCQLSSEKLPNMSDGKSIESKKKKSSRSGKRQSGNRPTPNAEKTRSARKSGPTKNEKEVIKNQTGTGNIKNNLGKNPIQILKRPTTLEAAGI